MSIFVCISSQINSSAGAAVQDTTTRLRTLQPLAQGDRQRRVQADRLQNEFQATASRFAEIQKVMLLVDLDDMIDLQFDKSIFQVHMSRKLSPKFIT